MPARVTKISTVCSSANCRRETHCYPVICKSEIAISSIGELRICDNRSSINGCSVCMPFSSFSCIVVRKTVIDITATGTICCTASVFLRMCKNTVRNRNVAQFSRTNVGITSINRSIVVECAVVNKHVDCICSCGSIWANLNNTFVLARCIYVCEGRICYRQLVASLLPFNCTCNKHNCTSRVIMEIAIVYNALIYM